MEINFLMGLIIPMFIWEKNLYLKMFLGKNIDVLRHFILMVEGQFLKLHTVLGGSSGRVYYRYIRNKSMAVQQEIKSQLAKLLATEDIVVEHKHVETAQFNVDTRVLILPLWEKASNYVYDMLVGCLLYTSPSQRD